MQFDGRARPGARLDMAPLIDVVLLLLIFFLLTSAYVVPEAIDLSLPQADTSTAEVPDEIVVVIERDGTVLANGDPTSVGALARTIEELISADPERAVTLKSDADVRVQTMLDVVEAVRAGGARRLSVATRPRTSAR